MFNKKSTILLETGINPANEIDQAQVKLSQNLDTQVKAAKQKRYRRKFNTAEKLKILEAYGACKNASERGALLRKEGLYYASITRWQSQLKEKNSNHVHSKAYKLTLVHNQVIRENAALKKKLAQAEAIIELQKKVSELLSTHILSPETSEAKS
jgi:transposase